MLEEVQASYIQAAKIIPNWQTENKNVLINACIDNENNPRLYGAYTSAVILRYWPNIAKYYFKSKASGFSIEDCYDWLIHAVLYTLEKRSWRDENSPLYNDPNGPDKVMNRCIYSTRQLNYYLANRGKRKANYGNYSLDKIIDDLGDHTSLLGADDESADLDSSIDFRNLIQKYAKADRFFDIIVLDTICNDDVISNSKKKNTTEFKPSKAATEILEQLRTKPKEIAKRYGININSLLTTFKDIENMKKVKLTQKIKDTVLELAKDKDLLEYLC